MGTENKEKGAQVKILGNKWLTVFKGNDDPREKKNDKGSQEEKEQCEVQTSVLQKGESWASLFLKCHEC